MKNLLFNIIMLICMSYYSFSQSPQNFNYQAVVRDALGTVIENQNVSIKIDILKTTSSGISVYSEEHSVTTNQFGLVNLEIGSGTILSGNFSTITWGTDIYFLQTEIDVTGGTNYQLMGVSQLLSVPYALYAKSSADSSLWEKNNTDVYYDIGNVGVGTITPNGRLQVNSDTAAGINDVIFSVLNANGDTVFAVYQEGVRIWVDDNGGTKANGNRGGFAVGGFSPTKAGFTNEYLRVTPDSVRVYIDDSYTPAKANGSRGGFAVGGFSPAKGSITNNYLFVQDDSTRIYTGDTVAGFGVKNIGTSSNTSYIQINPDNYFIGHEAGNSITVGKYNSFIGYQSGFMTTSGYKNYFFGYRAGYNNGNGYNNIFIGDSAGFTNTTGYSNIFIGGNSGLSNTTGHQNVGIGFQALYTNTSGNYNVANGYQSMYFNTMGNYNVSSGFQALYSNTTGAYNTAIGYLSLNANTYGYQNAANGYLTLLLNTTGDHNTANGSLSLALNTTGSYNTGTGASALYNNTIGQFNTGTGQGALYDNTSGSYNTANGQNSLIANTTGTNNTAVGYMAFSSGTAYSNSTALGSNATINQSNKVRLGNSTVSVIEGQVAYTFPSDGRFKYNVKEEVKGLEFITMLRPITYQFNTKKFDNFLMKNVPDSIREKCTKDIDYTESSSIIHTGFIAQEVEKAANECGFTFDGINVPKDENGNYGVAYSQFTVPLVKAVQEQQILIDELKKENERLKSENNKLTESNKDIIRRLDKLEALMN